jgi:hypothetical protein
VVDDWLLPIEAAVGLGGLSTLVACGMLWGDPGKLLARRQ